MKTLLFVFLAVVCLVFGQDNRPPDPENHFIYPPLPGPQFSNDPTVFSTNYAFTIGSPQSQPFKWVSNMSSLQIVLQQEGNQLSVKAHPLTECQSSAMNWLYWDGSVGEIDLKNGTQAYLAAYNCSHPGTTPVFFSHYINLTEPVVTQTSTATSTTAMSSATSLGLAATTTPTNSNEPASNQAAPVNWGAIGGGIGGGLGGAVVLIAIGYFVLKTRKAQDQQPKNVPQPPAWVPPYEYPREYPQEYYKPNYPPPPPQPSSYASTWEASELATAHNTRGYNNVISELPSGMAQER